MVRIAFKGELQQHYDLLDAGILIVEENFRVLFMNSWIREKLPAELRNSTHFHQLYEGRDSTLISSRIRRVFQYKTVEYLSPAFHPWVIPLSDNIFPDGLMRQKGTLIPILGSQKNHEKETPCVLLEIRNVSNLMLQLAQLNQSIQAERQTEANRKKVQKALRDSDERLNLALSAVSGGVWELNVATGEVQFSTQWLKFLGYEPGDIAPKLSSWRKLVHPDDQLKLSKVLDNNFKGRTHNYEFESRIKDKSGAYRWVLDRGKVVERDENGKPLRMIGTAIDITQLKHMEDEIQKSHNLKSLGILAGGIAHDFNNILTGVIGNLSLIQRHLVENSKEHGWSVAAQKFAERASELTSQLMAFAKGGEPVKTTAAIDSLIMDVTSFVLHGSNTKAEYQFAENLRSVDMDVKQLRQVIQNLVMNADQAMQKGDTIKLSANNVEISDTDPLPLKPQTYVKVSVTDEGTGMTEEVMKQVFDPYFSTKDSGHGLGLSISYRVVERHGGHITVKSEVGVGSTFIFYLPASEKQSFTTIDQKTELALGEGKILLMDDEESIRTVVSAMLSELGYEVETTSGGAQALEEYMMARETNSPFDLVIMDLTIPGGMGGREAVQRLRELHPEARVIVSSGYSNDPVMAHYADYGFDEKLEKPVEFNELAVTVEKLLKLRNHA